MCPNCHSPDYPMEDSVNRHSIPHRHTVTVNKVPSRLTDKDSQPPVYQVGLGQRIRKTGRSLVVAEDGKQMDNPGVDEVCFQINDTMYKWPMYIAPVGDEMLPDADFLHHYGANVDFCRGMDLEGHWINCRIERHTGEVNHVLMSESVTIPSGHKMVILAGSTGPMQDVGIFEPSTAPDESVLGTRVLVSAENPDIHLIFLNRNLGTNLPLTRGRTGNHRGGGWQYYLYLRNQTIQDLAHTQVCQKY